VLPFQVGPQLGKERRQLPAAKDRGVVQCRGLAIQRLQIVLRIQTLLVPAIRPRMLSDHLAAGDDRDVVHVALDGDGLKRRRARRAVAVVVETHGLVLVHLGRLEDARIERKRWQGQGMVILTGKALADGLGLPGLGAVPIAQGAGPQVSVQLRQVADLRHGGGPIALQEADPALDTRLLLRPPHQAEPGLEKIVTGQGLIAIVELALTAR
jgi:hypothetical protein